MLATPRRSRPSARWLLAILALAVIAFVAAIAVQRNVFPLYSGDHDEPVYRFQAELLRDGEVTLERSQEEFFRPWLSGPKDDRLVLPFSPGWPTVLLVSDVTTGSMLVALGAAAALTAATGFAFARELLGSTRRAALAAVILSLSPFTIMLSGTYLNYVFALALYLGFGALFLHGVRTGSRVMLVGAGLVLGAAFLTRPYDAVLFALPFAGYVLTTRRRRLGRAAVIAGWTALGAAPSLVVTLAYNVATSGGLLEFPVSTQSGGMSRFGWGPRSVAADISSVNYTLGRAVESMWTNLGATPTWMFGTYLTVGLAAWGAVRLWRRSRSTCALLIGLTVVWPVGYLAWWASLITTPGARNGVGPHYYLPMLIPLAVLAAYGAAELAAQRRAVFVGGVVAAIALTAIALPPKISDKDRLTGLYLTYADQLADGLRQRGDQPAIVTQEHRRGASYIMDPQPFIGNPPDLDAAVLYARDRGARNIDLLERTPDRRAFRIVRETTPGGEIAPLPIVLKPQSVIRGPALRFHTTITNVSGAPIVTAYARRGAATERRVLDTASVRDRTYQITWIVGPDGVTYVGPPAVSVQNLASSSSKARDVVVGATFSSALDALDPDAVERRYYARAQRDGAGGVEVLTADEEWTRFGAPVSAWLPVSVDSVLRVKVQR